MARTDPQVNFRIPAELRDRLQASADATNRTLSAELVLRLESTYAAKKTRSAEFEDLMREATTWFARPALPQPEWGADEFAQWPGHVSISDFTLFFALLSHVDGQVAAQLHDACLRNDWKLAEMTWRDLVVPLLGGAPQPEKKPKPPVRASKARASVAKNRRDETIRLDGRTSRTTLITGDALPLKRKPG